MIAIPNMEKPKGCVNCPVNDLACELWTEVVNIKNHIHKDCPLIEIVRCGECKYSDIIESTGQTECLARRGYWFIVDPTGFCSYGERRTDDHI